MSLPVQVAFLSGAPGPGELVLVFLVVLLLFGPRKLPGFARSLGNLMQQLRRASNEFRDQLMRVDAESPEAARVTDVEVAVRDDPGIDTGYDDETAGTESPRGVEDVAPDPARNGGDRPRAG